MARHKAAAIGESGVVGSCLWQWLRGAGLERFELLREGDGWLLRGTILAGGEGGPFEARYTVACDAAWCTRKVGITLRSAGVSRAVSILVDAGRWVVAGREVTEVRGAIDIDLSWSPSTNTLPIRRLQPDVGESTGSVVAAWLRFPHLSLEPLPQEYRRLSESRYQYSSRGGAFNALLEVDAQGLVIDYEGAWRQVT